MSDARDKSVPDEHHVPRVSPLSTLLRSAVTDYQTGDWLSQDKRHHHKFLNDTIEHVDKNPKSIHPAIKKFEEEVKNDTRLSMLFGSMFAEVRLQTRCVTDD